MDFFYLLIFFPIILDFEFKHCVDMHIGYTICVIIHTTA